MEIFRRSMQEPPLWHDDGPAPVMISIQRSIVPIPRPMRRTRVLHGDVLCDETGQLYERVGDMLRRLTHVIGSPRGELLDMGPATAWNAPLAVREGVVADADEGPPVETGPAVRMLLAPGTRRVVKLGDVRALVQSQLARPERLRDAHRLSCFVQVVEAVRPQPVSELVPLPPGGEPSRAAVERLTPALASLFNVEQLVAQPARRAAPSPTAHAGERFLLIQVANDPTATMAAAPHAPTRAADVMPAPEPPRTTIPATCLRPWEFVRSREEAEYDAQADAARGSIARVAATIRRALFARGLYRRWHALLTGRSADDQLWAVRPPTGSLTDPAVLQWAGALLVTAGYDGTSMIREWEIFWRRKGV